MIWIVIVIVLRLFCCYSFNYLCNTFLDIVTYSSFELFPRVVCIDAILAQMEKKRKEKTKKRKNRKQTKRVIVLVLGIITIIECLTQNHINCIIGSVITVVLHINYIIQYTRPSFNKYQ